LHAPNITKDSCFVLCPATLCWLHSTFGATLPQSHSKNRTFDFSLEPSATYFSMHILKNFTFDSAWGGGMLRIGEQDHGKEGERVELASSFGLGLKPILIKSKYI